MRLTTRALVQQLVLLLAAEDAALLAASVFVSRVLSSAWWLRAPSTLSSSEDALTTGVTSIVDVAPADFSGAAGAAASAAASSAAISIGCCVGTSSTVAVAASLSALTKDVGGCCCGSLGDARGLNDIVRAKQEPDLDCCPLAAGRGPSDQLLTLAWTPKLKNWSPSAVLSSSAACTGVVGMIRGELGLRESWLLLLIDLEIAASRCSRSARSSLSTTSTAVASSDSWDGDATTSASIGGGC